MEQIKQAFHSISSRVTARLQFYQTEWLRFTLDASAFFFFLTLAQTVSSRLVRVFVPALSWEGVLMGQIVLILLLVGVHTLFPRLFETIEQWLFRRYTVCLGVSLLLWFREKVVYPFFFEWIRMFVEHRSIFYLLSIPFIACLGFWAPYIVHRCWVGSTILPLLLLTWKVFSFFTDRLTTSVDWHDDGFFTILSGVPSSDMDMVKFLTNGNTTHAILMSSIFIKQNPRFRVPGFLDIGLVNTQKRFYKGFIKDFSKKVFDAPFAAAGAAASIAGTGGYFVYEERKAVHADAVLAETVRTNDIAEQQLAINKTNAQAELMKAQAELMKEVRKQEQWALQKQTGVWRSAQDLASTPNTTSPPTPPQS